MEPFTPDRVVTLMQDNGYRALLRDRFVASATNGLKFVIFPDTDGWMQFVMSLVTANAVTLEQCNAYNRRTRFSRVFLDEDGDITVTSDYLLGAEQAESFAGILGFWEQTIGNFRRFLEDSERENALRASVPAEAPAEALATP
jgi:hypothetical protein